LGGDSHDLSPTRFSRAFPHPLWFSQQVCVVPVFRQDLESVIGFFEEALRFFGGCTRRGRCASGLFSGLFSEIRSVRAKQ
jgi:hypothetical protein